RLLLTVHGIGLETADSILLFAFNKPTIPVSMQTLRVLSRVGLELGDSYEEVRLRILEDLGRDLYKLKLLHSSMTVIARVYCKSKTTKCGPCPLRIHCNKARESLTGI
ncbi:MAG: DNA repair protein, partial [Acidilobaceae archaeon]